MECEGHEGTLDPAPDEAAAVRSDKTDSVNSPDLAESSDPRGSFIEHDGSLEVHTHSKTLWFSGQVT